MITWYTTYTAGLVEEEDCMNIISEWPTGVNLLLKQTEIWDQWFLTLSEKPTWSLSFPWWNLSVEPVTLSQYWGKEGSIFWAQAISPPQMFFAVTQSTSEPDILSKTWTAFWESLPSLQITYTAVWKHKQIKLMSSFNFLASHRISTSGWLRETRWVEYIKWARNIPCLMLS